MSKPVDSKGSSTPDIPAARAKVTLSASTFANAGAALCFRKVLDTSVWRDWNHLVPEVTIRSQPIGDEWQTPFVSRNPSTARGGGPTNPTNSDPTLGIKKETGNHMSVQDPPEDRRSGGINYPNVGRLNQSVQHVRHFSISTIGGEPSVRLRLGTAMTFHVFLDPSKPRKLRKSQLVVSELVRPGDQTPGEKPVYRVMWESDTNMTFPSSLPKWLLFSQRVTEIRPVIRGDGKEVCEITTWECQRGLLARFVKKYYREYLQRMFEQNVQGLKEYCEAMGGAVDRRDFSISAGM
jgi:hypothetical protein